MKDLRDLKDVDIPDRKILVGGCEWSLCQAIDQESANT